MEPGSEPYVITDLCTGCRMCMAACPAGCIAYRDNAGTHGRCYIDAERCFLCAECVQRCPHHAIVMLDPSNAELVGCALAAYQAFEAYANSLTYDDAAQKAGTCV